MDTTSSNPLFPPGLLSASLDERMEYFTSTAVVDHPDLADHLDRLSILTAFPTSRNLVMVVGPTGVGKTTLLRQLAAKIKADLSDSQRSAGQVGSVYLELRSPKKGAYEFQVLHRAALIDMQVPLVDRTRPIVPRAANGLSLHTLLVERNCSKMTGQALEERFYTEVARRKPSALIFDEARAIFNIGRPKSDSDRLERLKSQADLVKDMANRAESTVVLGGAYDFFDLSLSSGQNARRSQIVHVRPYADSDEGLMGFATAVVSLLGHLPVAHELDPATVATELMLQSLGCVGIAAGVLTEALREAIVKSKHLDMSILRKYYYSATALNTMRKEWENGRRRVDELLSLEQLARTPDLTKQLTISATLGKRDVHALKPGDTKPSHMAHRTEAW